MDEQQWRRKLGEEGFGRVYVWTDGPHVFYPDHTHDVATAHVILQGEMTVISEGKTETYRAGGRFDVPAQTVHSARMGPEGCRYLVGEG